MEEKKVQKKNQKREEKKVTIGITSKKSEDFSEWYTQIITKAELFEYSKVSGCFVLRPSGYEIWENIQSYLDKKFKDDGVRNAYFPLLIPESLLKKESEHVEGFTPEVAWVTHSGDTKLSERLAIRPTSETIMYDSYAKWIRSHKDLPLRLNQWCNVVRWEFKHPVPFLRSREFLWQEGHTAFATKEEAEKEAKKMLDIYADAYETLLAVPVIKGRKSEKEKFAGADYTLSIETFLPNGKAIQCATSHHLGQNFAKAFDIKFTDKDEKNKHVWQNSWGFTTRSVGIAIMMHSDDKGLVLPPKVAPVKIVIVPIIFDESKEKVLKAAEELKKSLNDTKAIIDYRGEYSAGWKFNDWEMKGIPLRIEIGPKDLEKKQAVLVRRDTSEKIIVKIGDVNAKARELLEEIQKNLFSRAEKFLEDSKLKTNDWKKFMEGISHKKLVLAPFCGEAGCEDLIKDKSGGAKSINRQIEDKKIDEKCVHCGKKAEAYYYFGKSY